MSRILFGNLISLAAAVFLFLSGATRTREKIYIFQFAECAFLTLSQLIFGQVAGASAMAIGAARNLLAYKGLYNRTPMIICLVLTAVFGLALNGKGLLGIMPMLASLLLVLALYIFHDVVRLRIALIVNLIIWVVYSLLIFDIVTAITNTAALIINAVILHSDLKRARI